MPVEYKVLPFIGVIQSGIFSKENAGTVSEQLQTLINQGAQAGWEYCGVEKIDIKVQPGCLGALLGRKASYITFDQVVFRRTKS